jgi:hypothetical protein
MKRVINHARRHPNTGHHCKHVEMINEKGTYKVITTYDVTTIQTTKIQTSPFDWREEEVNKNSLRAIT